MTPQEIKKEILRQIIQLEYNEGDYCLIVYKTIEMENEETKIVFKVYNGYNTFSNDIENCLEEISEDFGVEIDIWQFD
jgi:hypothetical protein